MGDRKAALQCEGSMEVQGLNSNGGTRDGRKRRMPGTRHGSGDRHTATGQHREEPAVALQRGTP